MTSELINSINEIKNKVQDLQDQLELKTKENKILSQKNSDQQDELDNLNKVSMVAVLSRQIDEKNKKIEFLEKQINSLKSKKENLLLETETDDNLELIDFENQKLLKDLDTRKLYYVNENGSKGKYAGKESKKGKIKLKD